MFLDILSVLFVEYQQDHQADNYRLMHTGSRSVDPGPALISNTGNSDRNQLIYHRGVWNCMQCNTNWKKNLILQAAQRYIALQKGVFLFCSILHV